MEDKEILADIRRYQIALKYTERCLREMVESEALREAYNVNKDALDHCLEKYGDLTVESSKL